MTTRQLSFKTPEGQAQYLAAYADLLALWPVAYQEQYIETSHGVTHVITAGPEGAPPVLLLHAYAFNATEWYANIEALAKDHRVYAVDVMGDMTQTVQTRPFKRRAEAAVWLGELLDAFGIQRTIMIGHSYGGWLTLNMALCAPERLERIVLLAPASTFVKMVPQFNVRRILAYLFQRRGIPSFAKWCLAPGNILPDGVVHLMSMAMKHYRFTSMPLQPDVYTDEELSRITTPCLLLLGDHEVIYSPEAAVARAQRLVKQIKVQIIRHASHVLNIEQSGQVNEAIAAFING
jgi:pimeloyl-ACP methyl ester carboxylesterase